MPDLEMAARFLSSLGFNKGKQITKMEIFKLVFSGIQIDVWVARRHRPLSCYLVIKMIPKIPPCFGFHLLKQSVFISLVEFPLSLWSGNPLTTLESLTFGSASVEILPLMTFVKS